MILFPRLTETTTEVGEALDHVVLDPVGAWLALVSARSAVPGWDLLWSVSVLRSSWPVNQVNRL